MKRREFLARSGLALGAIPLFGLSSSAAALAREAGAAFDPADWSAVRDQFALARSRIHMATFLLASQPRPVAEAIERHRRAFDEDPAQYWHAHFRTAEPAQRAAAGEYLGADPDYIALTDSTTMGLGLTYSMLKLGPGEEILSTTHDHYSTEEAIDFRVERTGATVRRISLYDDPANTSVDQVVSRLRAAITDRTRVLAATWVHSSTGVKLPIAEMAAALAEINNARDPADRVLFCVDGVHGLGVEDVSVGDLGCDFFIAGTHKWLFGPRGTGIVWGRPEAWERLSPVIPSFGAAYGAWLELVPEEQVTVGDRMTPGGFHSFEHRWALAEAFQFHQAIGKSRVAGRIHALNTLAKEALADMDHVRLHTPMSPVLSAGMICFDVDGYTPAQVKARLLEYGIVASTTPYLESYARLAPSLINDEEEVERTVAVIGGMAKAA